MKKADYTAQRSGVLSLLGIATLGLLQLPTLLHAIPPHNPASSRSLACNENVVITLNEDGCAIVSPDLVLASSSACFYDGCFLETSDESGVQVGNVVCCEYAGRTMTVRVVDPVSGHQCRATITVADKEVPTPLCLEELAVEVSDHETTNVFAWMLDNGSFDNCGQIVAYSFSPDTGDFFLAFSKKDMGFYPVQLWVTDENGNQDFCVSFIEVKDNLQTEMRR